MSRRRPQGRSMTALAGWLFADLMLVMVIVAMAGQADPLADVTPTPTATHTPAPTPTPTPAGPRTLDLQSVNIHISGPATDDADLVAQMASQLTDQVGKQAGMVLVFGDGPCISPDTVYAQHVIDLLDQVYPQADPVMFPDGMVVTRPFLNGGGGGSCSHSPATGADLEIYYYTTAG